MIIHCGTQGRHCENSYHYKGLAADFHFKPPNGSINFLNQVDHLCRFLAEMQLTDSTALGLYPQWRHPGFHLDVRGYKARWGKVDNQYTSFQEALNFSKKL